MLAERYQYIGPQISDCLKSPLGSTDYNLAVSAVLNDLKFANN